MNRRWQFAAGLLTIGLMFTGTAQAQFFYVGPMGGDFFDEANWNDAADGSGASPAGDPLVDSTTGAIPLDLIIDNDSVVAMGQVDFGTGSLTMLSGTSFTVSGAGNDLDFNSDSSFSLTDASLTVDGDAVFEGVVNFSGGTVTALTDDVEFQDAITLTIDGTIFSSGDNTFFDGFAGSITNASFTSADRLGVRNNVDVVMTDTTLNVQGGNGDIDDVFAAGGAGSVLTLLGASTLLADSVEEGADLVLGGTTIATMGGQGERITADGSTITVTTPDVLLIVGPLDDMAAGYVDARPFLINGITGLSYADDPNGWNATNWDGVSPITLQIVPEPHGLGLAMWVGIVLISARRRRRGGSM